MDYDVAGDIFPKTEPTSDFLMEDADNSTSRFAESVTDKYIEEFADPELGRQIRCVPYGERSDVPRLQQVEQKAVGRQRILGLILHRMYCGLESGISGVDLLK